MAKVTSRITVLVSSQEKGRIARKAREAHMTVSEFLRRAATAYCPPEQDRDLRSLLLAAVETSARVDDAMDFIADSNKRIDAMEAEHAKRRA